MEDQFFQTFKGQSILLAGLLTWTGLCFFIGHTWGVEGSRVMFVGSFTLVGGFFCYLIFKALRSAESRERAALKTLAGRGLVAAVALAIAKALGG